MSRGAIGKVAGRLLGTIRMLRFITNHPLNSARRVNAVRRFITWQIGSRLAPGPVAISFVNDAKLLVSTGMTGATGNIYTGLHEFEDMAFVLHVLRSTDVFVDVGANIGSYTVLAGAVVGAQCIAFEPILETYQHLLQNVNLNGIRSIVTAENIGIGSEDGILNFTSSLDTVNHVLKSDEQSAAGVAVRVKTLDGAIRNTQPAIIKIDVEGFETKVVEGASHTLSRPSLLAVIMELNGSGDRYGFDEIALHDRMLGNSFQPFTYSPFSRRLDPLVGKNTKSGNTIYIRDVETVRARLQSAPPFVVHGQSV